jgi:hypothetical protein
MVMVVTMPGPWSIGAGFGIERRLDGFDVPAQTLHHLLNDVIDANADAVAEQLNRQMTIAQVPCDANEFAIVVRVDFKQRFGAGTNPDNPAVVQREPIAIAQPHRVGQIDQQFLARLRGQNNAAAMAAIEIDQDLIDRAGP